MIFRHKRNSLFLRKEEQQNFPLWNKHYCMLFFDFHIRSLSNAKVEKPWMSKEGKSCNFICGKTFPLNTVDDVLKILTLISFPLQLIPTIMSNNNI